MEPFNKDKGIAAALTIVVFTCIIVGMFYLALVTPLPLPGEEGVEVDMGYYQQGKGEVQPVKINPPKPQVQEPEPEPVKETTITAPDDEAPALKEEEKKEEKAKKEPVKKIVKKKVQKPQQTVKKQALFKGNDTSDKSESQGNSEGAGDQGNPNGLSNINRYEGQGGEGEGISFSLGGRGAKYLERPQKTEINEEGIVVVDIWVDRDGNVTEAEIAPKGTNVINAQQRAIALDAAKKSSFAPDPNAQDIQKGTITYIFKFGE